MWDWVDIPGLPGYTINREGEVMKKAWGRRLRRFVDVSGRTRVRVTHEDGSISTYTIHRLLANTFFEGSASRYEESFMFNPNLGPKEVLRKSPIEVLETGEVFPTIAEAARAYGASRWSIQKSVDSGLTFRGLTFVRR